MSSYISKIATEKGLKKVDAAKSLSVEVTSRDIRAAAQGNSKCCAFARACKRQMPEIRAAYFFRSVAWIEYSNKLVRYMLPSSVQKEIVAFDRSRHMEPGIYQISQMPPTLRAKKKARTPSRKAMRGAAKTITRPLTELRLEDLPPTLRRAPIGHVLATLAAPTLSRKTEAVNRRSQKRPGRHEPSATGIKRSLVHRTTGIRTLQEPSGTGDQ